MAHLRLRVSGSIDKPLPQAIVNNLTEIQNGFDWLKARAVKIGNESTDSYNFGNEIDYIWFKAELAFQLPLSIEIANQLPTIRQRIRIMKQYAISHSDTIELRFAVHICHHGETPATCESEEDI